EVPPAATPRVPAFRLTDPPRRFDPKGWDGWRPFPDTGFTQADPDEEVSAGALCRRIEALKRALDDLDGHARRFARRQARRAQMARAARRSPLRAGLPPGHDKRAARAVDHVLAECHGLALQALRPPDTS
ncbi:MAG: hypothetical protein MRY80_04185, partial [Oricola sp.]|nr:hypothetical protein [Oricola sp.]